MKAGKHLIGKFVEIQWRDPAGGVTRQQLKDAPIGRAALATWREYGVVDNITDGVVRIVHSAGAEPGEPADSTDEICMSAVPEELIERIRIFETMKEEA